MLYEGLSVVRLDDRDEEDGVPASPAHYRTGSCITDPEEISVKTISYTPLKEIPMSG